MKLSFFAVLMAALMCFAVSANATQQDSPPPKIPANLESWKMLYENTCRPATEKVVTSKLYLKKDGDYATSMTIMAVNGTPIDVMFMLFEENTLISSLVFVKSGENAWTRFEVDEEHSLDVILSHTLAAIGITAEQHADCKTG